MSQFSTIYFRRTKSCDVLHTQDTLVHFLDERRLVKGQALIRCGRSGIYILLPLSHMFALTINKWIDWLGASLWCIQSEEIYIRVDLIRTGTDTMSYSISTTRNILLMLPNLHSFCFKHAPIALYRAIDWVVAQVCHNRIRWIRVPHELTNSVQCSNWRIPMNPWCGIYAKNVFIHCLSSSSFDSARPV